MTDQGHAVTLLGCIVVFGLIAWVIVLISALAGTTDRNWLAAALERVDGRLLDRLNTLLFLESRPGDLRNEGFALRIARQTKASWPRAPPSSLPFRAPYPSPPGFYLAAYRHRSVISKIFTLEPFGHSTKLKTGATSVPDKSLELGMPATNNIEQDRLWGEVRITDPGADLKSPNWMLSRCRLRRLRISRSKRSRGSRQLMAAKRLHMNCRRQANRVMPLSTRLLFGRVAFGGLGCGDLLRQGEYGKGQFLRVRGLLYRGASFSGRHPEATRWRRRQAASVFERDLHTHQPPAARDPADHQHLQKPPEQETFFSKIERSSRKRNAIWRIRPSICTRG